MSMFHSIRKWKRMKKPSIFFIGFAAMSLFVVIEFLYDKYRRSGLTLTEYFRSSISKNSNLIVTSKVDDFSNKFQTKFASVLNESEIPQVKPTRIIPGTIALDGLKLSLFQYQNCPFCCKVRTFLDYYGLPYEIIEVNPVMRQQIKFSKHYGKVPILLITDLKNSSTNEEAEILQINDSTLIVSAMNSYILSKNPKSRHNGESLANMIRWYLNSQVLSNELEGTEIDKDGSTYGATRLKDELINRYFLMIGDVDQKKYEKIDPLLAQDRRWRRWVDDHLVHVLSPNIYRTMDEAFDSFNYFAKVSEWDKIFSKWEIMIITNVGAMAMYMIGKRLKKKYRLKDDVRQSLYDSCNYWLKAIGPNRKFMGGDTPSLSDLTVYGVLSSIEGCQAFGDLMQNTKISEWYYSVKSMVNEHHGANDIQHLFVQ
uniref:Prostaglandin E synthase 2 n=1 Tax=Dermatophagoides pteronyssinus TaxID=6956 RepID=A0A6P6XZ98_DERPT|nr:prostaglandin E synthase 2-like [Dermatophagoides pteronyssinus]